jgi:hypothetical protein
MIKVEDAYPYTSRGQIKSTWVSSASEIEQLKQSSAMGRPHGEIKQECVDLIQDLPTSQSLNNL